MSALHLLRDGSACRRVRRAAVHCADRRHRRRARPADGCQSHADAERATPASRLQALHVTDAALELRLLGLLADVRVMQTVRNDTANRVDLGAHLPAVDRQRR